MAYKHFHLFNCTLTAQLSYIFRTGGTGQPPATIWFSQVGKENIFSSCQVLQARCENQPCKPTWSTWYHTGCMGTRAGGFLEHRNRSREHAGCAGASCTAQPTREANPQTPDSLPLNRVFWEAMDVKRGSGMPSTISSWCRAAYGTSATSII